MALRASPPLFFIITVAPAPAGEKGPADTRTLPQTGKQVSPGHKGQGTTGDTRRGDSWQDNKSVQVT